MLVEIPFAEMCEGLKRVERSEVKGRLFTRPTKRMYLDDSKIVLGLTLNMCEETSSFVSLQLLRRKT